MRCAQPIAKRRPKMDSIVAAPIAGKPLILMRWAAIIGQTLVLLSAHFWFDYQLMLVPALCCIAALLALNFCAAIHMPKGPAASGYLITERAARASIIFDSVQLSGLLFFTGGIENPFVMLLIAPLTVGATLLKSGDVATLLVITLLGAAAQFFSPFTIHWEGDVMMPVDYMGGLWFALLVTVVFITSYIWSVTHERRRLADALAESEAALARTRRASDIGALAAAIAHELSTPLGTMLLIANELAKEKHGNQQLDDDIQTLLNESKRCKIILADLSSVARRVRDDDMPRVPLCVLVTELFEPYAKPYLHLETTGDAENHLVLRRPELTHGLANFLSNAADFAKRHIGVHCHAEGKMLQVIISDDGAGFAPALLQRLGEPYVGAREDGHMGLGVFIATTLLERTGAKVTFANAETGGAQINIIWPNGIQ